MNFIGYSILMLVIIPVVCLHPQGLAEYCIVETFEASCSHGEVIVMTSAKYGFFGVGRCVKFDFGVNCSVDVMDHLENDCSWKQSCTFDVGELYQLTETCLSQVTPFLLADYKCIAVESSPQCRRGTSVSISGHAGSMAYSVARQTGCGSIVTPWRISVAEGQTVEIKLVNFDEKDTEHNVCPTLGYITNEATKENTSFCETPDSATLYKAQGQSVKVQMAVDEGLDRNYILEYQVTGCMDLVPPDFAWYQRSGDDAVIGCQYRNMTWSLHCDGYRWNGVVGRCNDTTSRTTTTLVKPERREGHQLLIIICIVSVVLIVIILCITVGIMKLIDRNKERNAVKRQLLLDHSATLQYSRGPPRTMQPMYNERIEMVPDILESSLPRGQPQYPTYTAESESSYGTNYPGTMYYMGHHNYSNMGPQRQYQQESVRDSRDYETVTLPKKPETVSDSESEDMYATIPAYDNAG